MYHQVSIDSLRYLHTKIYAHGNFPFCGMRAIAIASTINDFVKNEMTTDGKEIKISQ